MPPSGRAAKPSAYVPNASSVPVTGSDLGKKSAPNTRAAAEPYRKKSYHSTAVPTRDAKTTLTIDARPRRSADVAGWTLPVCVDMVALLPGR
jgi:hypothetical protein